MKTYSFLFFMMAFLSCSAVAQIHVKELKKKHLGNYEGTISGYVYASDTSMITVDATPVKIHLTDRFVDVTIGRLHKKGSYHILFKGKDYYVIDAFFEGDVLTERIILNEKRKTILREGNYPQPNTVLNKTGKK